MALLRLLRRTLAWGLVAALLVTNVLTLTWGAFNAALSGAVAAVGVTTVAAGQAARGIQSQAVRRRVAQRVKSRTIRGAQRSLASTIPSATPVLGVPILLAVTGWELYDACQTMKDVAALEAAETDDADPLIASETAMVCGMSAPSLDEARGWYSDALDTLVRPFVDEPDFEIPPPPDPTNGEAP